MIHWPVTQILKSSLLTKRLLYDILIASALSNYHEGVILMTTTFTAIELNLDLIVLEKKPKFLILTLKLSLRKGV